MICAIGLVLVIVGSLVTEAGASLAGTGIIVVGALAALYGIVVGMLFGFATIQVAVASFVRIFRRKPPTDAEPGDEE